MSIAHELSSDVAAAVFVRKDGESKADTTVLTEIVLQSRRAGPVDQERAQQAASVRCAGRFR